MYLINKRQQLHSSSFFEAALWWIHWMCVVGCREPLILQLVYLFIPLSLISRYINLWQDRQPFTLPSICQLSVFEHLTLKVFIVLWWNLLGPRWFIALETFPEAYLFHLQTEDYCSLSLKKRFPVMMEFNSSKHNLCFGQTQRKTLGYNKTPTRVIHLDKKQAG